MMKNVGKCSKRVLNRVVEMLKLTKIRDENTINGFYGARIHEMWVICDANVGRKQRVAQIFHSTESKQEIIKRKNGLCTYSMDTQCTHNI